MKRSLLFALPLIVVMAVAQITMANPYYTPVVDNDETASRNQTPLVENPIYNPDLQPWEQLFNQVDVPQVYLPFEQVTAHLSPYLEEKFDLFILVNTATRGSSGDLVAYQNMRVVRRTNPGQPVFTRDRMGNIDGVALQATELGVFPVSSGNGNGGILTFSGIFRVDYEDTKNKFTSYTEAPMSYAMYIDFKYAYGRDSGVAIHGTPSSNHKYLGVKRASHGCVRTLPSNAKYLRNILFSSDMWSNDIPAFNQKDVLPNENVMYGRMPARPGIKALMIFFDGYQKRSTDI